MMLIGGSVMFLILVVLIIFILTSCIRIVPQAQALVVERLGGYLGTYGVAGSIVDVSQLQCMLDKAMAYGYKNAGFILDRGYFSRENIKYMDKCGYDFVIMVKGMKALVNDAVKEVRYIR